MPLPPGIRAVVTDIEGTTTPIAFVHETLFPFAEARLESACSRVGEDERVADALLLLRTEHAQEIADDVPEFGDGASYARHLMSQDRKSTGLKALQGVIWERGYEDGSLVAPVFGDVPPALAVWREEGARLRVFSSGSVLAQKLLFSHTDHGDLTDRFEGFHDTTTGPKREARAYRAIAADLGMRPAGVLYLSDVVAELDAAAEAGMSTGLLVRPGNPSQPESSHRAYRDFAPLV